MHAINSEKRCTDTYMRDLYIWNNPEYIKKYEWMEKARKRLSQFELSEMEISTQFITEYSCDLQL